MKRAVITEINVEGTIHLIRHFVPAMIERGAGVVVNFSSGWGRDRPHRKLRPTAHPSGRSKA